MAGMAYIQVIGNVGQDPETRQAGRSDVCSFTVAVNKPGGGRDRDEVTIWFRCNVWGREGEGLMGVVDKYVQKGKQVAVHGDLAMNEWEDRDGNKRTTAEVTVRGLTLLGGRDDDGGGRSRGRDDDRSYRGERDRRSSRDDRRASNGRDRDDDDRRGGRGGGRGGSQSGRDLDDEIPFAPCWQ
jgi:single-strand DNA-binding protein